MFIDNSGYWKIAKPRYLVALDSIKMRLGNTDFYAYLIKKFSSSRHFFVNHCLVLENLPLLRDNFLKQI